ncbi:MAG TPA: NADH-quinone oxidoreductase subunit L, partial [Acidobacteriota bacterium]|nr:NADH-quinone oxidoreductase subunit L [Acidobacteriota bacterium]
MPPVQSALLLLLTPLASATLIALFLRRQGALAQWVSVAAAAVICALSLQFVFTGTDVNASLEWLRFGNFSISLGFKIDALARLMMFVVGFVGFLIHVFSMGYMHDDAARARFFGG